MNHRLRKTRGALSRYSSPAKRREAFQFESLEPRQLLSAAASSPEMVEYALPADVIKIGSMVKGPDGNMWFTYEAGQSITQTNPTTGTTTSVFVGGWGVGDMSPTEGYHLLGVTNNMSAGNLIVGPDNNLWTTLTPFNTNTSAPGDLVRISTSGAMTEFSGVSGQWVVAGPNGLVWATGAGQGVGEFDPSTGQMVSSFGLPAGCFGIQELLKGTDGSVWIVEPYEPEEIAPNGDYGPHVDGVNSSGALTFRWSLNGYGDESFGTGPGGDVWLGSRVLPWVFSCAANGYPAAMLLAPANNSQLDDSVTGIASPGDGLAYACQGGIISVFDPTTEVATFSSIEGAYYSMKACATFVPTLQAQNIAAGSDGNVWFSENAFDGSIGGNPEIQNAPAMIGMIKVQRPAATLTDNTGGTVNPGQTVTFTLNLSGGPDAPASLAANVMLPAGLTYVAGSSSATVLSNGLLHFTTSATSAQFTFEATVPDKNHLPLGVAALQPTAYVTGFWPDGRTPHTTATDTINLSLESFLNITLQPELPIPGQVQAGQSFTVTISAQSDCPFNVQFNKPAGTTMYGTDPSSPAYGLPLTGVSIGGTPGGGGLASNQTTVNLVVNSAANLPANGQIVLLATGTATKPDGSTYTATQSVTLQIGNVINVAVTPSVQVADAGGTITYTIHASTTQAATSWAIQNAIPAGTTYVPGSASNGGTLTTNSQGAAAVQWNITGGSSATVSFSVKVANAAQLSPTLQSINDIANAAAIINGTAQSGSGSANIPLRRQYTITGVVRGASSDFPSTDLIDTSVLAGATVKLYCPDGSIKITITNAGGAYTFTTNLPGTYSVEISGGAQMYSDITNTLLPNGYTVTQTLPSFTIQQGQVDPTVEMNPAYLPTGLVSRAEVEIDQLNNLPLTILAGVVDYAPFLGNYSPQYFSNFFHYKTTAIEQAVSQVVASAPVLTVDQLIGGAGSTTSPWLALARTIAVMAGVQQQFTANLALADDMGKAIALTATALAIKQIKPLLEGNISDAQKLEYAIATQQRTKFTAEVTFQLQYFAQAMGLSQEQQDQMNQVLGWAIKAVTAKATGKGVEDSIYEVMFNCLRYGIEIQSMMSIFGVSSKAGVLEAPAQDTGLQGVLDDAAKHLNADEYLPGVDTTTALQRVNAAIQKDTDWASTLDIQANAAALGCSFVVQIDKLIKKQVEILGLSGYLDNAITSISTGSNSSLVIEGKEAFSDVFADLSLAMTTISSSELVLESANIANTMFQQANDASTLVLTTFGE